MRIPILLVLLATLGSLSALDWMYPGPTAPEAARIVAERERLLAAIPTAFTPALLLADAHARRGVLAELVPTDGLAPPAAITAQAPGATLDRARTEVVFSGIELLPASLDLRPVGYWVRGDNVNRELKVWTWFAHYRATYRVRWTFRTADGADLVLTDAEPSRFETHHRIISAAVLDEVRRLLAADGADVTAILGG